MTLAPFSHRFRCIICVAHISCVFFLQPFTTRLLSVFPPQSLLCDPNPNSPANSEAARLYQENRREYNRRWVKSLVLQDEGVRRAFLSFVFSRPKRKKHLLGEDVVFYCLVTAWGGICSHAIWNLVLTNMGFCLFFCVPFQA